MSYRETSQSILVYIWPRRSSYSMQYLLVLPSFHNRSYMTVLHRRIVADARSILTLHYHAPPAKLNTNAFIAIRIRTCPRLDASSPRVVMYHYSDQLLRIPDWKLLRRQSPPALDRSSRAISSRHTRCRYWSSASRWTPLLSARRFLPSR